MIRKPKLWITRSLLVLFMLTFLVRCQRDDNEPELQTIEDGHVHSESTTRIVSADDIPEIMNYLATRGNSKGQFTIIKQHNGTRSSEPDLVIGELQTREIIEVTDQYDRSNYTFLLTSIERTDLTVRSTFNLVVKESTSGLFSYITEYRPDANWIPSYRDTQDFSTFTGEIMHYSIDGRYIAKLNLVDGIATNGETRNPCPDDGDPNGDPGNNGGNDGSPVDGSPGDGSPGDGGVGDDTPIDVDISADLKWLCVWRKQLHNDPGECDNQGAGGSWVIVIEYGDKSVEETLRCPDVPNVPVECVDENLDPCACNADGTGCLDSEEPDTNPNVGTIFYDLTLIFALNEYLEPDLTPEQVDWIFENIGNLTFAELALEALENGGYVDFEEHIIYDFSDKPCQKNIIETVISNSSDFTDLMNNTFNSNGQTNLRFSTADIPTGDPIRTAPFPDFPNGDTSVYYIDIQIDNSFLETATDLSIAGNVLHELVHAYLINFYITSQMSAESSNYNDLLNAFIGFYDNSVPDTATILDNEIHNAMIDFIENAGESLFNYAQEQGIPVNLEYCTHLIWGTMFGTELFEEVLTEQEQINYGNIAAIEQENESFEGNAPQGSPCD